MDVNEAMKKIDFIKGTIEDAKVHYRGMYLMCFLLGGSYIIQFIIAMLEIIPNVFSLNALFAFNIVVEIMVLFGYFLICKKEKEFSNKYYLSLLSIWGFISIAVPIIFSIVDLIVRTFFNKTSEVVSLSTAYVCLEFSKILLFSIFMIICSYILDNYFFRILSILILFGYFFSYICFNNEGISIPFVVNQKQMGIGYGTIYIVLVVYFGYFIMGAYLKCKEGKLQKK